MLLNLQTSVKKFLGMFCMSVCSVIVPLSHVLHVKTKVQALRDNIGDYTPLAVRANRKVIRSVWQYGDGRRGGGMLPSCPGNQDHLASQTDLS